jgi:integrase
VFERPAGSGVWWVLYYDESGQRHREKVGLKSAALSIYQQRKTEIRQGKFEPEGVKDKNRRAIMVAEIISDKMTASKGVLKGYKADVPRFEFWKQYFEGRPGRSVTASDIEKARIELAKSKRTSNNNRAPKGGRAIATVNRYLAVLKAAFSLAIRNGKAEKNPVKEIRFQKENNERVRYLTPDEESQLFAVLPAKYHALVLMALHTGLRRMELFRLQWDDINLQQRFLRVREAKSGEGRNVPLNDVALLTLQRLPRRIDNPFVFPGEKSGEHRTDVPKSWEEFLKQAGVLDFTWHDLRHTFASRLVMAGVDLYTVSKLLGHADIKMTQRYSHLSPGHLADAVNRLNDFATATKTATRDDEKNKAVR